MDFSQLPAIPKMKIMKMLNIGDRYNFSLVFPEMEGDVRRSIPPVLPFLSKELGLTIIDNLSDLESAGVLASYGYLESIKCLQLDDLDVTNVPLNILSSLTRDVRIWLIIHQGAGLELSMLGNLNCENLELSFLSIPTPVTQEIHVRFCGLHQISGNLCGLLDSITCDTLILDNEFDDVTCDSLSKMLPSRVRKLELSIRYKDPLFLDFLAKYDGMGRCSSITFTYEKNNSTEFEENLAVWTTSKGWTVVVSGAGGWSRSVTIIRTY